MILQAVFDLILGLLKVCFGWINLPQLPASVQSVIDEFLSAVLGGVSLLGIVVDMNFVKILIPLLVAVIRFDDIYKMTMWVIRKLPFSID